MSKGWKKLLSKVQFIIQDILGNLAQKMLDRTFEERHTKKKDCHLKHMEQKLLDSWYVLLFSRKPIDMPRKSLFRNTIFVFYVFWKSDV